MAAIVENAENRQMGSDLTYPQSSDSDSLLSSESVLDASAKGVDYGPVQKVNGVSHLTEDPLLQKTGANNTHGTGTVKADTPQSTLVNSNVTNNEKDFSETSRTREVVTAKIDSQSTISRFIQNKSPPFVAGSSTCGKDEKKVKLEVPLDSKSNSSLSFKKAENNPSSCDGDESKKSSVSSRHSDIEQKVGIKFEIPKCNTNEQFSSSSGDTKNKEKPLISENGTTNKTSTLEDKCSKSDFNDNRFCKTAEKPTINGNEDNVFFKETKTISSKSATDQNAILKKDSNVREKLLEEKNSKSATDQNAILKKDSNVREKLLEEKNSKSASDHNAFKKGSTEMTTVSNGAKTKSASEQPNTLKKDLTPVATIADKKKETILKPTTDCKTTLEKDLSHIDRVADEKLQEKDNSKSATDYNATLKKELTDTATVADKTKTITSKSDHTDALKKDLTRISTVVDKKLLGATNSKSATDCNATLKKELTGIATIADEKLLKETNLKSSTKQDDVLKKDLTVVAKVADKKLLKETDSKSSTNQSETLKKDLKATNEKLLDKNNLKSKTDHKDTLIKGSIAANIDKKLSEEKNSKPATDHDVTLKKNLTNMATVADGAKTKSATDHTDALKKNSTPVTTIADKKLLEEKNSKPATDHDVTLKKNLTNMATVADGAKTKSATDHTDALKKNSTPVTTIADKKLLEETYLKSAADCNTILKKDLTDVATVADEKPLGKTNSKLATDHDVTLKKDLTDVATVAEEKHLEKNNSKSATDHTDILKKDLTCVARVADEKLFKEKINSSKSSANKDTLKKDLTDDLATFADKDLLEKNNLKSSATDQNSSLKKDLNMASVVAQKLLKETNSKSATEHNDKDLICETPVADVEKNNSKSAIDQNATFKKDLTDISTVASEKLPEEANSRNCPESSSGSPTIPESKTKTEKSSGVSNIPELLAYCSPCRVVLQDFFKELNIDLLELSRNFPVHHRKRLKPVQGLSLGEEQVKNNSFDALGRTKQAKCYTESSKKRKKHPTTLVPNGDSSDPLDDEDEEDNLPLLSVRNNLTQGGNITSAEGKFNDNKTTAAEGETLTMVHTKGANSGTTATEERFVTDSTSSDVPLVTPPTKAEPADLTQTMPVSNVPPTVNIDDSNDLGLKIVSISSQGSVFFPAFTSDENSENIVFSHSDTSSKLNGQLDTTTCENSTTKLSHPKCKFHGPDSSPAKNLYKCKKCGLEAKSLSDIQAHMGGSHSEFCMYRCPFCMPPLRVKRVGIYDNRPIEFEVLRESSHKLLASASSTNTTSSAMTVKRKLPRHIRIQREKRRKLNYYYHNQREIKKYKNRKVSCQYCHKMINQSNISRHQNSKKCSNPMKKMLQHSLMLREKIPKKYQKVKCDSCQKHISRTNMSKHSRICPRETED